MRLHEIQEQQLDESWIKRFVMSPEERAEYDEIQQRRKRAKKMRQIHDKTEAELRKKRKEEFLDHDRKRSPGNHIG